MGSFGMEKYKREDVFGVFLSFSKREFFSDWKPLFQIQSIPHNFFNSYRNIFKRHFPLNIFIQN